MPIATEATPSALAHAREMVEDCGLTPEWVRRIVGPRRPPPPKPKLTEVELPPPAPKRERKRPTKYPINQYQHRRKQTPRGVGKEHW